MEQDNQMEAVLFAYLAGIIDGEGTIRITKDKPKAYWNFRHNGAISVGMTDKSTIELLIKTFSPNVKLHIERVPNRKLVYRWGTSGNKGVVAILKKILPYLRIKKKQAQLVIKLCEGKKVRGYAKNKGLSKKELQWRDALWQKVRNLNH